MPWFGPPEASMSMFTWPASPAGLGPAPMIRSPPMSMSVISSKEPMSPRGFCTLDDRTTQKVSETAAFWAPAT